MAKKINYFTISHFLFPRTFCKSWAQMRDSSRGYYPVCPQGSTICCALVTVAQASESSSLLNLLCPKDQANENCGHRSGIYFPQVVKGIPQHVFFSTPFSSCPSLPLSMALFTKYWAGHHLSISESCVWNHLSKIGTQTHVAGTGRDSVLCLVTQSWAQPKPMVPGFRA